MKKRDLSVDRNTRFTFATRPHREMTLPRTAIHEAAHAVVAVDLDRRVYYALINRKTRHGYTVHHNYKRNDPLACALISLAGDAAERVFYRQPKCRNSYGDMKSVIRLGFRARTIATLKHTADLQVKQLEPHIRRVADALLVHGRLSGAQIKKIVEGEWRKGRRK